MTILASGVSVDIESRPVLHDIDFELRPGELLGLIGPNGSGKSTLMRTLVGLARHRAGQILLGGRERSRYSQAELARMIAYLPQDHTVHWPLYVENVVALGREPHLAAFRRPGPEDSRVVAEVMTQTGINEFKGRSIRALSAGERARVLLARAMAVRAPFMLADEPTAALDPRHQLIVMGLLRSHALEGTGTVVVVHDLSLAAQFCTRLYLLNEGRVMAEGAPEFVLNDANIGKAYGVDTVRVNQHGHSLVVPVSVRAE